MTQEEYEDIRDKAIDAFKKVYKDKVAFDYARVDDKTRLRLLQDPVYIVETKAIKASLFINQVDALDDVIVAANAADDGKDHSSTVLKAIEMKQKILLDDLAVNQDENASMNITFVAMTKEEFENQETIEIHEGTNDGTELSSSFGEEAGEMSAEAKMKQDVKERLAEMQKKEEADGSN